MSKKAIVAKIRNDSIEGKRALAKAANEPLVPIEQLTEAEMRYFQLYATSRPSFMWSPADRTRLTKLAQRLVEVDMLTEKIKERGIVDFNARKTPVISPLLTGRDQLERTILQIERSLSLYHPIQDKGDIFEQAKEVDKIKKSKDDDLLA